MADWQLLVAATNGGPIVRPLEGASSRRLSWRLDPEAPSVSFAMRGRDAVGLVELSSDVVVLRDGVRLLRGRVGQTQDVLSADTHTVNLEAVGYLALLDRRHMLAGLITGTLDQGEIAWRLVDNTQSRPGGNLGITRGVGQVTGITRERTYEPGQPIGRALAQLAEVDGGFDLDISPDLKLDIYYPARGSDRGVFLAWGTNVTDVSRTVQPERFANVVTVKGADGLATATRTAVDVALVPEGRVETWISDPDLREQATVDARAVRELVERVVLRPAYVLTLKAGGWGGPDHVWLGDTVRLAVQSGRLNVVTTGRVTAVDVTLSDEGAEEVRLTVGPPTVGLFDRVRRTETRLDQLARR